MSKKKAFEWLTTAKDPRIQLVIILIIIALVSIFAPINNHDDTMTNLQFGLDLAGGTWIQLEFQSEVVAIETGENVSDVATKVGEILDCTVVPIDQHHLEVLKDVAEEELRAATTAANTNIISYEKGVSKTTAETVKRILESKINSLGTNDVKVNSLTNASGVAQYMRIEMANIDLQTAQEIVGKQGLFEIRIVTSNNETVHVLYGETVASVQNPTQNPAGSNKWGVGFTLDNYGAKALQQACIQCGATINPRAHNLNMYLDGAMVYSAPLSNDLAMQMTTHSVNSLYASTSFGSEGHKQAQELEIHLRAGALPVQVEIVGTGTTSATLGNYFKIVCLIAGLTALAAVAIMIYLRYRVIEIVLPMIATNMAEIIILLGIAVYIQQLDIAAIAALIAVIGTGIDQLVIITDEVIHEGKIPSPTLYLKRLTRALSIIMTSATTMIIAMLPLIIMDLSTLKGFAIINILGILIGVFITRPAYGRVIMDIMAK
ncbi:MAG TPA: preprotein translocase subunit SecD [Methanocorpusculum sp.]|nr:preprotein translocase subunit SecD [Methanocorpusculum sp.]